MAQTLGDLPVGAKVKAKDSLWYGKDLIFRKLGAGHSQDPADSVILQTNDIITARCFDAKEPTNSDYNRSKYGNNRYLYSNLLQWLNSDASANAWYSAQHNTDQKPDSANVLQNSGIAVNPYDTQAGFMNGFTADFKNSLLTVTKRTAKNTVTDGGGYEDVESKFFLLSTTEVGLENENNVAEGSLYSLFNDETKRIMVPTQECADNSVGYAITAGLAWYWWLRTPYSKRSFAVQRVNTDGTLYAEGALSGNIGVAPACAISKNQKVSDTPDADGCYVLLYESEAEPLKYVSKGNLSAVVTKLNTKLSNRYTKAELNALINSTISGVTNFDYQIVDEDHPLPSTGEKGIIYLVPNEGSGTNLYNEKIWIVENEVGHYEEIGKSDFDDSIFFVNEDIKVSGITKTNDAEGNGFTLSGHEATTLSSGIGIEVTGKLAGSEYWETKTWTGLTNFYGDNIWTDGENIYFSNGSDQQYVLDKTTSTWNTKTWTGLIDFYGMEIWTDGTDTYYSGSLGHYVLDKTTSTWSTKTWNGLTNFYSMGIWTDGADTYYSSGSSQQYVLDKTTSTWSTKTWNGLTNFYGANIWTDGTDIYLSSGSTQYVLDKSTNTWNTKTWTGLASFNGNRIWTDGENIYFSNASSQYVIRKVDHNEYTVKTTTETNTSLNKAKTAVQKEEVAGTANQISVTEDELGNGVTVSLISAIKTGAEAGATALQPNDITSLNNSELDTLLNILADD